MISVPSPRQLLNGNKFIWIAILCLFFQSCKVLGPAASGNGSGDKDKKEDTLPAIEGTRVYDPVQQKWVTIQAGPSEKMDTLEFADAPTSQVPPITMDGVETFVSNGGNSGEEYKVAVLLPFRASRVGIEDQEITSSVTNWSLQFYGALKLALNDLENDNMNLNVTVIDTEANPSKVEDILYSRTELTNADVIIGPYRRENIRLLAEFGKQQNKVVISPYSAATNLTKENPNFIQVSPSLVTHCESLVKHAREEFEPEEIILVARDIPIEQMCLATIQKEHFNIMGTSYTDSLEYIIAPGDANELFDMEIDAYFETEDRLAFIIPSWADESFIYGLLRKIDIARKPYQEIVVYGLPQWMDFEHVDFEYYEKLNVRVSSNTYVDQNNEQVKSFRRDFYDQYGILPSNEAYLGYDLMKYIGKMLQKHGTGFAAQLDAEELEPYLHTRFNFQKVLPPDPDAVELMQVDRLENKYVNILEFNNYAFELSKNN